MIVSVIVISASMYCFYLLVNYLIITWVTWGITWEVAPCNKGKQHVKSAEVKHFSLWHLFAHLHLSRRLLLRMPTPEAISVIIIASQKSAPVAVTVISYITSE